MSNKKEAKKISSVLLDKHVIACANIVKDIDSRFWWKGKREKATECLLIAKTTKSSLRKVIKIVRTMHSYEVPEIVALPIVDGYKPYLDWLKKVTI